jgi:hypothetical protein
MRVSLLGDKIEIIFSYSPAMVEMVKTLGSRQYAPKRKSWLIPLAGAFESVEKLKRWGFNIDEAVELAVRQDAERGRQVEALVLLPDTEFTTPLPLYNFQRVVSAFMVKTGSCLNACGVRTGKTIMTIAAIRKLNTVRNLVIVPGSVLYQWGEGELQKWDRDAKVYIVYGNKRQRTAIYEEARNYRSGRFYVVLTYDIARIDVEELQKF